MTQNAEKIYISLVVLTYNRPHGLRRCLKSILRMRKEYIPFEVIVVDDGSTTDNGPVINDFKETLNLRFLIKEHGGVASTRNFGAKAARGKLVAFIADDYLLPQNYLIDVIDFFENHQDAYVITHNIKSIGPSIFSYVQRLYFQLTLLQRFDPQEINKTAISSFKLPPSRAAVFRKEIFDLLGYFNEDFLTGEDGEFGMRMSSKSIPVNFFPNKYIEHWEEKGLWGYLDQRTRYGGSYYRAICAQRSESGIKPSFPEILKLVSKRYYSWLKLSRNIDRGLEYFVLSPLIILFLGFYYFGFYSESKQTIPSYEHRESRVNR